MDHLCLARIRLARSPVRFWYFLTLWSDVFFFFSSKSKREISNFLFLTQINTQIYTIWPWKMTRSALKLVFFIFSKFISNSRHSFSLFYFDDVPIVVVFVFIYVYACIYITYKYMCVARIRSKCTVVSNKHQIYLI